MSSAYFQVRFLAFVLLLYPVALSRKPDFYNQGRRLSRRS